MKGAAEDQSVGRREVAYSAVSDKSLARGPDAVVYTTDSAVTVRAALDTSDWQVGLLSRSQAQSRPSAGRTAPQQLEEVVEEFANLWLRAMTPTEASTIRAASTGQQRGSAMGAHYRHTSPEMATRIATAIEQRLKVVLEVAEQALQAHPNCSTRRVF